MYGSVAVELGEFEGGERFAAADPGAARGEVVADVAVDPHRKAAPNGIFLIEAARELVDLQCLIVGVRTRGCAAQCGQCDDTYHQYHE
ncbi:MAG TPA: hypothetical protein VMT34_05470 [Aggregatilineales bacterium]|nr:hypothetical protein [Aggregatilineales bacterium]